MRKNKLLLCLLCLILISFNGTSSAYANDSPQLNIETISPDKVLFALNNLKPGDTAQRKLTVQNKGNKDFTYLSDAKFTGGSEELFNEFLLDISDSNGILYTGLMKDFTELSPRLLKAGNEEDLIFRVEFPWELGNEFQGEGFGVQFRFYVKDTTPGNPDPDPEDPEDPENPGNPDPDPEDPENPGNPDPDPEDPDNPVDPDPTEEDPDDSGEDPAAGDTDENTAGPQRPISPDRMDKPPTDGEILPATATNLFNYIVGGMVLVIVGFVLLFIMRNRRIIAKH